MSEQVKGIPERAPEPPYMAQLAASQARVGELEKALQEALMIIEVGLDTGTFELAGSLADIPARCRAAIAEAKKENN